MELICSFLQFSAVDSVKDTLIKKLKSPLNLSATQGEDFEHLKELAKQYYNNKPTGKQRIANLTLSSESDTASLKTRCEILLNTNAKDNNYDRNLEDAENWCTKESAPRKISDILNNRGKILLTKQDKTEWEKPWEAFRNKYQEKDPVAPWNFDNWGTIKSNTPVESIFQDRCITNGSGSVMLGTEIQLLSEIEEYCTKNKSNV